MRITRICPEGNPDKDHYKKATVTIVSPIDNASHFSPSRPRNLRRSPFHPVPRECLRLPRRRLHRLSLTRKLLTPDDRRHPGRNLRLRSQRRTSSRKCPHIHHDAREFPPSQPCHRGHCRNPLILSPARYRRTPSQPPVVPHWSRMTPSSHNLCYDFSLLDAYGTMYDSYRTFGLMTLLCLPSLRYFLMAVAFYV